MKSLTSGIKHKVLIGGYINLNVIDGSAFFISGLAAMCAQSYNSQVFVLTANPISKTEVLQEILPFPNVEVIDPYRRKLEIASLGRDSMSREIYAKLLGLVAINNSVDAIILRDTETASFFIKQYPELAGKLSVYLTGITSIGEGLPSQLLRELKSLVESDCRFLCQTDEIRSIFAENLDLGREECEARTFVLGPHVPDPKADFETLFQQPRERNRFVYTGKFFKDWNTDKIVASFKAVNQGGEQLILEVAGDQFRKSEEDENFVANMKYLLHSTPGLIWHGRVPREQSREIISRCNVGIGWRSERLSNSTEFSTKILEYGAMGRAAILNRTPMHERLLGSDYPLFANSMTEFKEKIISSSIDQVMVKNAAKRCYDLAKEHGYSRVRPSFISFIGDSRNNAIETVRKVGVHASEILAVEYFVGQEFSEFEEINCELIKIGSWVVVASVPEEILPVPLQAQMLRMDANNWEQQCEFFKEGLEMTSSEVASETKVSDEEVLSSFKSREAAALKKVEELEGELTAIDRRYSALKASKLGSIQVQYWKMLRERQLPKIQGTGQSFLLKGMQGLATFRKRINSRKQES